MTKVDLSLTDSNFTFWICFSGHLKMKLFKQDKGQKACAKAFVESIVKGEESPISYEEVMESSRVSIEVANSLRN